MLAETVAVTVSGNRAGPVWAPANAAASYGAGPSACNYCRGWGIRVIRARTGLNDRAGPGSGCQAGARVHGGGRAAAAAQVPGRPDKAATGFLALRGPYFLRRRSWFSQNIAFAL